MAMWELGLNLPGVARLHLMDTQVLARMSRSPSPSGWLTVDQGTLLGRCISVLPDNLGVSDLNSSLPCLRTLAMASNCPEPRDLRQVGTGENKNAWGISKWSNVMQTLKNHDQNNQSWVCA